MVRGLLNHSREARLGVKIPGVTRNWPFLNHAAFRDVLCHLYYLSLLSLNPGGMETIQTCWQRDCNRTPTGTVSVWAWSRMVVVVRSAAAQVRQIVPSAADRENRRRIERD
jgi:hypothetical protein